MKVLTKTSESSRNRERRATWLLCVTAAVAVLICAKNGLGMDVDSTDYLAAAVNLANGHGLIGIGDTPFTLFGPALPSFVSVGVRLGMSAQVADLILNVVSAVLTVILGRILLQRHVSNSRLVLAGSIFIAVGWPLLQVTSLALTEPLTVVVLLLLVLVLEDFDGTRYPMASLGIIVILLNLAFFLRYAGMAFIPMSVFVVFIGRKYADSVFRRILSSLAVVFLALVGPFLWMLRNHSVDGTFLGPRYPSAFDARTVANQFVLAVAKLFLPGPAIFEYLVFVTVVLATALALRLVYNGGDRGLDTFIRRLAPWAILLYACITYVIYLYAAELFTQIDPIDSRLLVPIYVPCVVLVVGLVESVLSRSSLSSNWKRPAKQALVVFTCIQVLITCVLLGDFATKGRDFTSSAWRTSPLVIAAKSSARTATFYTNNVPALWARIGDKNTFQLPASVTRLRGLLLCSDVRIVYFTQAEESNGNSGTVSGDTSSMKLSTLKSNLNLKEIFSNNQGEILRGASGGGGKGHCS